jgi:diguanylate cyclase (GGDEF)-like protein
VKLTAHRGQPGVPRLVASGIAEVGPRLAAWLGRWLTPEVDRACERERDGRLSALLCAVTVLYNLVVLTQSQDRLGLQIALDVAVAALAPVLFLIPWRRLPDGALFLPVVMAISYLTVAYGAVLGQLSERGPLYTLAFCYTGLVLAPGRTFRVAGVALIGLGAAAIWGNQHDGVTELVAEIVIGALIGELIAAAVAGQRRQQDHLKRLQSGLAGLLSADGQAQAADLISHLAADLLQAQGVQLALREHPGASVLVGCGGYGLGEEFATVRIDLDADRSGGAASVRSGQPVFVADASNSPLTTTHPTLDRGVRSVLYVPVIGRSEVIGVITVWWSTPVAELDGFVGPVIRLLSVQAAPVLERLQQMEDLDRATTTDPLTGVGNRRAFEQRLARLQVEPGSGEIGLIMCDLDRFKAVNDRLGHPAGDRVLRAFAAAAAASVRESDLVARIGGDEFAVLVFGGSTTVDMVLLRLNLAWTHPDEVGFSAGTAVLRPGEGLQQFWERADRALYAAKGLSRSTQYRPGT